MTAMTTQVLGLPHGRPLTRADLHDVPDDGHRYELIDGVLIVSPAPKTRHQVAVVNLILALAPSCSAERQLLTAPFDVVLADDTVIQPDIVVAHKADLTEHDLPGAPLLAVEVLSPSTRGIDLLLKKDRLARAGCPHYWAVDPDEPSITAWTLVDGAYVLTAEANDDEEFRVSEPFETTFTPAGLVR